MTVPKNETDSVLSEQPNRETLAAMREAVRIARNPSVKGYTDMESLFSELKGSSDSTSEGDIQHRIRMAKSLFGILQAKDTIEQIKKERRDGI